jgi:hypothetical protein
MGREQRARIHARLAVEHDRQMAFTGQVVARNQWAQPCSVGRVAAMVFGVDRRRFSRPPTLWASLGR